MIKQFPYTSSWSYCHKNK